MKNYVSFLILFYYLNAFSQNTSWSVKISSNVELRTWKLTTRADKEEKPLLGASITLTQGGKLISQSTSDSNGDFTVMVPGNGEFVLTVSYPGCNAKKFSILTTGAPPELQSDITWKPSFSIGGFVMAKPFPGIDYTGLQQTLVKVIYEAKIKNFDDDEPYTDLGLGIVGNIASAENALIEKFCSTNKSGDAALAKPDCPLAKMLYEKAIALIPGEQYPVEQLKKVGDCLKAKEEADKKAAETAQAKTEAERLAKEKAVADKALKDQKAKEKAAADKIAKEKAAADKLAKEKATKENTAAKNKTSVEKEKPVTTNKPKQAPVPKEKSNPTESPDKGNISQQQPVHGEGNYNPDKHDSKYKVPQVLGANKYKEALNKAEGYFKMKRYAEAKTAYEEVLKIKPGDAYSVGKLEEVKKILTK